MQGLRCRQGMVTHGATDTCITTLQPSVRVACGGNINAHAHRDAAVPTTSTSNSIPPWAFGFQMNERYLDWDTAAHLQLLKRTCAEKLGEDLPSIEAKLKDLAALVPDLTNKIGRMKADVLLRLLSDTEKLADRLSRVRELLPNTNVSELVSRCPAIALDYEGDDLASRLANLRSAFDDCTDVEWLVTREPNLLRYAASKQAVDALLDKVHLLLDPDLNHLSLADSKAFLFSHPDLVLDMDSSGLPSAIDGDLTQDES